MLQKQTTETEIARREAERRVIATKAEVQKAYAEGIGSMGPAISSGGGGSGVLGDLLGLGVGMAAASTVAPQIGNMM